MAPRRIAYARMGVREFWLLDTRQDFPLMGFTLDAKDGNDAPLEAYRPLAVGPGGGQHSRVLGTSLRWVADTRWWAHTLECWHAAWECWVPVLEIPIREAKARGRERGESRAAGWLAWSMGHLDLLLALGVPPDIALEMGLDLWLMEIRPGLGALLRTQGNLEQLRRQIPVQPRGQGTAGLECENICQNCCGRAPRSRTTGPQIRRW